MPERPPRRLRLPDGGTLAYEVHGPIAELHRTGAEGAPALPPARPTAAGPVILLLRPLGGSMALWGTFRDLLARDRTVLCFDPRGAGYSSAPPLGVTTRRMARDALALLDYLGVEVADVFGLSLGGMVGSWLAIDAPRRVRRLVLGSTVRRSLDISRRGLRRALELAACALQPTAVDMEVAMVHRVLSVAFRRERPDEVRLIESIVRATPSSRFGVLSLAAAAALHDAGCPLHRVRAPVLLLWGERDALLRPDTQARLRQALPAATHETIRRSGHDLSLEQPEASAAQVAAFLGQGRI